MRPIVKVEGSIGLMILIGQFDFNMHREFREASQGLLENDQIRTIRIDFAEVPWIDSSALGMLLLLRERASATRNIPLELLNCRPDVKQIFAVASLLREFNFQPA
ncbi:STAS domain-containing protein [Chromobacterium sphagni]|uniref:Anti-anti-sigma factor n=1 Tax=Chromobacterium sphagni TaxID=1903179 RepID=A0A1S1X191_9NEIS|nr:STAS domain-containing protein [Chromobacterium sphagni]OHX13189.1 anti-anti-sigma factor [Chromobacterium sphagni]OHX21014.1 anti-anti-sigma factor [Chromobacterium sphagni]